MAALYLCGMIFGVWVISMVCQGLLLDDVNTEHQQFQQLRSAIDRSTFDLVTTFT